PLARAVEVCLDLLLRERREHVLVPAADRVVEHRLDAEVALGLHTAEVREEVDELVQPDEVVLDEHGHEPGRNPALGGDGQDLADVLVITSKSAPARSISRTCLLLLSNEIHNLWMRSHISANFAPSSSVQFEYMFRNTSCSRHFSTTSLMFASVGSDNADGVHSVVCGSTPSSSLAASSFFMTSAGTPSDCAHMMQRRLQM